MFSYGETMKTSFLIAFLLCATASIGQLCQGSLGDPIVNITFGSGINPGPPLPAGVTKYQYIGADCILDSQYCLRNSTFNCFSSTWHNVERDHTGNPNGYFMLVNASVQPISFYVDTVDLQCSNTTYEFAAWLLNLSRTNGCGGNAIRPNLTFRIEKIDGTVIQSYNTGAVNIEQSPTWKQFGFFFNAPANVSKIVLRITNNAAGGCGNDLALDDITFRPCGPLISPATPGGVTTYNACEGTNVQFPLSFSLSTGFNDPYYQWQRSVDNGASWQNIPGATNPSYVAVITPSLPAGKYLYRLGVSQAVNSSVSLCRVNSGVITIMVNQPPTVAITAGSPVCTSQMIQLNASGGINYYWTGPNGFQSASQNNSVVASSVLQSGKYYLEVIDSKGCLKRDSVSIVVNEKPTIFLNVSQLEICQGEQVQFQATGGSTYAWLPATGLSSPDIASPTASPSQTTTYRVVTANSFSCYDTAEVEIKVNTKPSANAGPDQIVALSQSVQLQGTVAGTGTSFVWSPNYFLSNVNTLKPLVTPDRDTSYILTATSMNGCGESRDTVNVKVYSGLYIPSAFSPNGDGLNDTWAIPVLGAYKDYIVQVFDRFGREVFTAKNVLKAWDGRLQGRPLPAGIYVYYVRVNDNSLFAKGTLLLLR